VLAELGRGAQGRVYLATQPALADRPVVLKLTSCNGREHLALAQLQHMGIVPLYFAQDDPAHNLRMLCMPYFGGMTLAQLFEALRDIPLGERTAARILQALDRAQEAAPVKLPLKGPFRFQLANRSYMGAICWIGAFLADALQYAHEHGLVHLDIKPSNALVAADGQPMLLDFHLAQAPIAPNKTAPEWIGGTLTYMPREQQAAMTALNAGQPITTVVDGRADIFSLGALLYQALGGNVPVLPGVSPPLCRCNPQVSVGLSDIIGKCLAYHPRDRYQEAAALAADLRRHLSDQKLHGVRNRSWSERWKKWRRRSPSTLRNIILGAVVVVALVTAWFFEQQSARQQEKAQEACMSRARAALLKSGEFVKKHDYHRAVEMLQEGRNLVKDNPDAKELLEQLTSELGHAKQLRSTGELQKKANKIHKGVETIRYVYGGEALSFPTMRKLRADCASAWDRRREILDRARAKLPRSDERRLQTDLFDLAIILSDLKVRLAPADEAGPAQRRALEILDEAEQLFGPSAVLERERRVRAKELGDRKLATHSAHRAARMRPRTAWEHCLLARSLMRSQQWVQADAELEKALDLEPQGFWPNYYQGVCAYQSKRYQEAVNAFRVCIALKPTSAVCFFNRALAHAALRQTGKALRNAEHALKEGMDSKGLDRATVYYRMAVIHEQRRDRRAALRSLQLALDNDPNHQDAQDLFRRLQQ
jgi:serine/threonine protein kinase